MRTALLLLVLVLSVGAYGQGNWSALIVDTTGNPIPGSSVALLQPSDSTVVHFTLSDENGNASFKGVAPAHYLIHVNAFGYEARELEYDLSVPLERQLIVLQDQGTTLSGVDVIAERSPIVFKEDTIEYNAGSFKTKPDAVVEDLLKKLPGVEVGPDGTIKAQGNEVEKIKIDGQEFFSNDPALVSKNVPADAIKKVQVVNDKTDEERFSGIDDGEKNTTINLVLKDDKKSIWFGSLSGGLGYGTDLKYDIGARAFQFTPKRQLAFLGMANSINKFGFSFQDYIEFNGGIQRFMDEGGRVEFDGSSFPIDFGQPLYGAYQTGVGALNVSFTPKKGVSHLLTGMSSAKYQKLDQTSETTFYQPSGDLQQTETSNNRSFNQNNALNYSFRHKADSNRLYNFQAGVRYASQNDRGTSERVDELMETKTNGVSGSSSDKSHIWGGNATLSAQFKPKRGSQLLRFRASTDYTPSNSRMSSLTQLTYYLSGQQQTQDVSVSDDQEKWKNGLGVSSVHRLTDRLLLDIGLNGQLRKQWMNKQQSDPNGVVDTLSGISSWNYPMVQPQLQLRRQAKKWNATLTLAWEQGEWTIYGPDVRNKQTVSQFVPQFFLGYDFSKTSRIQLNGQRSVILPNLDQVTPIARTTNPLLVIYGNPGLKPELQHRAGIDWNYYDNFTFMSLFTRFDLTYTQQKIALQRTIGPNAEQLLSYANVPEDIALQGSVDWSTPIRKLGITFSLSAQEAFTKGYSYINNTLQRTEGLNHSYEVRIENRKKTVFDASVGVRYERNETFVRSNASYNTLYEKMGYFGSIDYTLKDKWNFGAELTSNQYSGTNLNDAVIVPLLQVDVSRYFGKAKHHLLTLSVYDVLGKNLGVQQNAQLNFISTTRSNVLERYAMLKYTYRINKAGTENKGVSVEMRGN